MTFWGNPVTSGSNKIDYYISADILEHPYRTRMPASDDPYSEQVILLEGQGIWYFQPVDPAIELARAHISHMVGPIQTYYRSDFNIPDDAFVFLLPQSVFKIHPLYDLILSEILFRGLARGINIHLVVTGGRIPRWTRIYTLRLITAIGEENLSRLHIIERVSSESFNNLLKISNVILHPFPFDGSRTSADSLIVNIPYVTMPTEYLKGRMGAAFLRTMNLSELIASDIEEYIEISLKLAEDTRFYKEVQTKIIKNLPLIWEDMSYPYQWTIFFQRLLGFPISSFSSFLQQTGRNITHDMIFTEERAKSSFACDKAILYDTEKGKRMKLWQLNELGIADTETLQKDETVWPKVFEYWKHHNNCSALTLPFEKRMINKETEERLSTEDIVLPDHYKAIIIIAPIRTADGKLKPRKKREIPSDPTASRFLEEQENNEIFLNHGRRPLLPGVIPSSVEEEEGGIHFVDVNKQKEKLTLLHTIKDNITSRQTVLLADGSYSQDNGVISETKIEKEEEKSIPPTPPSPSLLADVDTGTTGNGKKKYVINLDVIRQSLQGKHHRKVEKDPSILSLDELKIKEEVVVLTDKSDSSLQSIQSQDFTSSPLITKEEENDVLEKKVEELSSQFTFYFKQGKFDSSIHIGNEILEIISNTSFQQYYPKILLEMGIAHYLSGQYHAAYHYCVQSLEAIRNPKINILNYYDSSSLYSCLGNSALYLPIDLTNHHDIELRINYLYTAYLRRKEEEEVEKRSNNEEQQQQMGEEKLSSSSSSSSSSVNPSRLQLRSNLFQLTADSIEYSLLQAFGSYRLYDHCLEFLYSQYHLPPVHLEGGYILFFSPVKWNESISRRYINQVEELLQENHLYSSNTSLFDQIITFQKNAEHVINPLLQCFTANLKYRHLFHQIQTNLMKVIDAINTTQSTDRIKQEIEDKQQLQQQQQQQQQQQHPISISSSSSKKDQETKKRSTDNNSNSSSKKGIALITQFFIPKENTIFREDLEYALIRNLGNPFISDIFLLLEEDLNITVPTIFIEKIHLVVIHKRLSFSDAFLFANEYLQDRIVILANADIYFHGHLQIFYEPVIETDIREEPEQSKEKEMTSVSFQSKDFPSNLLLAILKWKDIGDFVQFTLRTDSQDAWIFKPPISSTIIHQSHFYLGLPRCDNRIAEIFYQENYTVLNTPFQIRAVEIQRDERLSKAYEFSQLKDNEFNEKKPNNYRNGLYDQGNAVIGNGRSILLSDYFELWG
jgi:hypothetical protein